MPSTPPISPRSSAELQQLHQPTPSARSDTPSGAPAGGTSTPQTPVAPSGAMPAEQRHGSTQALLSRRAGGKPATPPPAEETDRPSSDEQADGATIVQSGNPTAMLMDIQKIQSVTGMVQSAEQGLASMTTSASRHAVDAVQDIAA